jgi:hypothetical protein
MDDSGAGGGDAGVTVGMSFGAAGMGLLRKGQPDP